MAPDDRSAARLAMTPGAAGTVAATDALPRPAMEEAGDKPAPGSERGFPAPPGSGRRGGRKRTEAPG